MNPHTPADPLPYRLDRTIVIQASREEVFRFFTANDRWSSWWGAGSTIEPRPGGRVRICLPGGVEIGGEVLEIDAPRAIVFTYGFSSGTPFPEGSSRVTIALDDEPGGATRLRLSHAFAEAAVRDEHVQGWRYQLSVFANVAANAAHAGADVLVDAWFAAWSEPDAAAREALLDRITTTGIRLRDRFSAIEGIDDLRPHLEAVHRFMPGIRLTREGDVRHCQGAVLADWMARGADGQQRGRGTSLFLLSPAAGRITDVTGFWG
jgi:uncharacterized protein YndB with AHSA1/START domain